MSNFIIIASIIGISVCLLIGIISALVTRYIIEGICSFLVSLGIVLFIALIVFLVCLFIPCGDAQYTTEMIDSKELIALNDGTHLSGHISGGGILTYAIAGQINSKPVYKYYYLIDNDTAMYGEVPARDTKICFIEDGTNVRIEKYQNVTTQSYVSLYPDVTRTIESQWYCLYVPRNSIISDIRLDLQ